MVLLERLRVLCIENQYKKNEIQSQDFWNEIPKFYKDYDNILGKHFSNDPFGNEKAHDLKKEYKQREKCLESPGPIVPGGVYLSPSTDLLENKKLLLWFSPYDTQYIMAKGGEYFQDLTPTWLPFDKAVYTLSCSTNPDPQLQQVVDILARTQDNQKTADASESILMKTGVSDPSSDQPESKIDEKIDTENADIVKLTEEETDDVKALTISDGNQAGTNDSPNTKKDTGNSGIIDTNVGPSKQDETSESEESEEDKKESPKKDPSWIIGRKGDIFQDTESSTETDATHDDSETDDDDEDDKPLSAIIKVAKKPRLPSTAKGFTRQAENEQSHTSQLRRMRMKKMKKKRRGLREKNLLPANQLQQLMSPQIH